MTLPKLLGLISLSLFLIIGTVALFKRSDEPASLPVSQQMPLEVELDKEIQTITPALAPAPAPVAMKEDVKHSPSPMAAVELPDADRINEFFNKDGPKLPIVETITYKSHVSWQKGRPAWLSDYASHYSTSRHFIARSLNGRPDYVKQDLAEGDRFNVLRKDKNFEFALVVDTSRCKMWFFYNDLDEKKSVLLKSYQVGLGRLDASKASGLLTPLGKYLLGDRTATYKPKSMGTFQGKKTEMISIFGTRWIPFEKEIGTTTAPAKGFGLHGTPWTPGPKGELVDNSEGIGKYESDGCIRMATPDLEELYAIIISKPTTIEIVKDYFESSIADAQ